ncbi:MAG: hypothetical protein ACREIT_09980, partial [Tepidisphaeraceae bacterium]
MSVAATSIIAEPRRGRDPYRFGEGPDVELRPGTLGWTAVDLDDPEVGRLWRTGRYEIIEGVLAIMPAACFRGGNVAQNLVFVLRHHLLQRNIPAQFAPEIEVVAAPPRVFRPDYVGVFGDDLGKFASLRFPEPDSDWR